MDYCEAGSIAELYEDLDMPFTEPQIILICNRVLEASSDPFLFSTLSIFLELLAFGLQKHKFYS
jgi:hypothetical protein